LSSDVRHHRLFSPNRRPLLISALLVLLTSVPTMIVVVAGSATLENGPSSRAPVVADPQPGPVVVGTGPTSGLRSSGVPDRHSLAAVPTAPQPPVRPRATSRASGGTGGGDSGSGTASRAPRAQTPTTPAVPSVEASDPEVPIQDRAWPGWDGGLKGKGESSHVAWPNRYPSGSVDRADSLGRSAACDYLPARGLELWVTTAQARENGLHGHCAQPAVQPVECRP
jgi:hypothetical protein